ncbi:MAG: hypothetical protein WCI22_06140 [Actinomycetota bacterium]
MPLYLGGDVLAASNNGLQAQVRERADPREPTADVAVRALITSGAAIAEPMASLGVRWVVLQKAAHLQDYLALDHDPGLEVVIDTPDIALYSVIAWRGEAQLADGSPIAVDRSNAALVAFRGAGGEAVTWNHPASGGWRRGGTSARATADGRLEFATGGGSVWNVATVPSLAAQLSVAVAVVVACWRLRPRRHRRPTMEDPPEPTEFST